MADGLEGVRRAGKRPGEGGVGSLGGGGGKERWGVRLTGGRGREGVTPEVTGSCYIWEREPQAGGMHLRWWYQAANWAGLGWRRC